MAKLTEVLMWWEKVPNTPTARKIMKGWVYEVAEDADYNAGSPDHEKPFYFVEICIPINRFDLLAKQGLIRDFTRVVLEAEGSDNTPANARRVWVTINELKAEDWGIGGHTDWLRDYTISTGSVRTSRNRTTRSCAPSPMAITSCCMCTASARRRREATLSSTSSGWRTARSSSIGT
jgi:phenylpyruvate tautomerase PptA (4-oxalocrotonate tautomerase family)